MRRGRLDSTGPHACLPKGAPFPAEVSAASALCSQSRYPPRMAAATGEGGDPPGRGTLTARELGPPPDHRASAGRTDQGAAALAASPLRGPRGCGRSPRCRSGEEGDEGGGPLSGGVRTASR